MNTKKYLSILTSVLMLSGAFCALPELSDGTALFPSPIIAEAGSSSTVYSGEKTELLCTTKGGIDIYLWQDPADRHLEICGARTYAPNPMLDIPATFKVDNVSYPITGIRRHAFQNQTRLSYVKGKITSIGGAAFCGCTKLKYLYFNDNNNVPTVKTIADCAFQDCTSLSDTDFASNATQIGAHTFWGCTGLQSIKLNKLQTLGIAAFYDCTNVKSIQLSDSALTAIPDFAFHNNCNAAEVHLPETLTSIGMQAFSNCNELQSVYIPDTVTTIGSAAFMHCGALKTVMMSENITSIADHAFFECPSMKFFVSKNRNASIGQWAVGWHLENTLPVRNTDFVIWSSGTGKVNTYASNNGFTFRNVKKAASLAAERFVNYEWATTSDDAWSVNGKYYINAHHLPYVSANLPNSPFGGLMTGLDAVSALTASGYLSVSDFAPRYSSVRSITTIPKDTISYVSTVNNKMKSVQNNYDYVTNTNTHKIGKEMLRYAEYITYGADVSVLLYLKQDCTWGDFRTCFGLEFKQNASDKNDACWNGYDARLMLYNTDRSMHNKEDYLYVNLSNGTWRMHRYNTNADLTNTSNYNLMLTYSPDKMFSDANMTADAFFAAIRN